MKSYAFMTVDVFTDRVFGGNQLAVFPDARDLSDAEMQSLAAEFNLSETAFVLPPSDPRNSARVRIFSRRTEMPFAGHPNVGTAFVLASSRRVRNGAMRFEQLGGIVSVEVGRDASGGIGEIVVDAPAPLSVGLLIHPLTIAGCASLDPIDVILDTHPVMVASVGIPFVVAEVTPSALARARPNLAQFERTIAMWPELNGRFSLYLHCRDGNGRRARMFGPLSGTVEDAATGSAAATLAGVLLQSAPESLTMDLVVAQGESLGRPSRIRATAYRTAEGIRARLGGRCVPVLNGLAAFRNPPTPTA